MKQIFKMIMAGAAMSAFLAFPAGQAAALSVDEILVMVRQGVPESVIVSVVRGANDLPALQNSDAEKLRTGGASQNLVDEITKRSAALSAENSVPSAPVSDTDAAPSAPVSDTDAAPSAPVSVPVPAESAQNTLSAGATAPEDTASGSEMPPVPGAEVLSPALPADVQLVQETVLAPAESSNAVIVFEKFFDEAYETFLVESQVARRYDELQYASDAAREDDAELPTVAGYRAEIAEHPVRALESCLAMASERRPHVDTALGAALNRCIGESLGALGAEAMGAAYLDMALQSEAALDDYSSSFAAFLRYAHKSDYSSTSPLKIKRHESEISSKDRDAFNYFVAYSFVYGPSPDPAIAYHILSTIKPGSIEYIRARILLATLDVRAPKYRFKTAAEHLDEALGQLEKIEHPDAFMLKNTVWLSLARIAAENHAYDAADAFYRRVDVNSHRLRDAMLEDAWTQVFAKNYSSALSLTHAMRAPIFEKSWLPDMLLIEAGAYLGLCRYDMALRAVETLRSTYIGDAAELRAFMAETPARDYYVQIMRHAEDSETSHLPARIYYRVISDLTFRTVHRSLKLLGEERKRLGRLVGREFTSWPHMQKIYDDAIAGRQQAMSVILGNIFESSLGELHALDISASQVAIEVRLAERRREAECLKIVAAGGKCREASESVPMTISKGSGDAFWTFDGEFWRDELRSYAAGISSLCE